MKIYIVFENVDVQMIQNIVTPNDLIIGDIGSAKDINCKVVIPSLTKMDEGKIASCVQTFFDDISTGYLEHIKAFSNAFYEATILPVATYLYTLQKTVTNFNALGFSIEVVFPSSIMNKTAKTVYFLAEHESQRKFLYKRQLIFQPYLEIFCKNKNITISFVRGQIISHSFFTLPLRRLITLFFRFCKTSIKIVYERVSPQVKPEAFIPDFIAVTRLARKSEFLEPILTKAGLQAELIVAENFVNLNSNWTFCKKYYNNKPISKKKILTSGIRYLFVTYVRSFLQQFFKKGTFLINICGINVNCKNALKEVLVSYPDLLLYMNGLSKTLQQSNHAKHSVILSTELKSPHAYADAIIAHNFGYTCFHIMDCDQSSHPMPTPVFGDLFVTNTNSAKEAFIEDWGKDSRKVVFWGNLSQMNLKRGGNLKNELVWCFFTSARLEEDLGVIEKLDELRRKHKIQFIIKLHPRDKKSNYTKFRELKIMADEEIARNELFKLFAFGLTFSSAVIHDLMLYQKQFLIVDNVNGSSFNRNVHSEEYEKLVIRYNDIVDSVLNVDDFKIYFEAYNEQYLKDLSTNVDLSTFKENLLTWKIEDHK